MKPSLSQTVSPTRDARANLPKILKRFRRFGRRAQPLVFGAYRKPEAVVLPYQAYLDLTSEGESTEARGKPAQFAADNEQFWSADSVVELAKKQRARVFERSDDYEIDLWVSETDRQEFIDEVYCNRHELDSA